MQKTHVDEAARSEQVPGLHQWRNPTRDPGVLPDRMSRLGATCWHMHPAERNGNGRHFDYLKPAVKDDHAMVREVAPTFGKHSVGCRTRPGITSMVPGEDRSCQGTPVVFNAPPSFPNGVKSAASWSQKAMFTLTTYCIAFQRPFRNPVRGWKPLRTVRVAGRDDGPLLGWR